MPFGLYAIYTIHTDRSIFKAMPESAGSTDKYNITAYKLPIKLDSNILVILIVFLQIIPVASNIMQFIHRFSKNIISKYTVNASPLLQNLL